MLLLVCSRETDRTKRYVPSSRDQDIIGPSASPTAIVSLTGAASTGRSDVRARASTRQVGFLAKKIGTAARITAGLPLTPAPACVCLMLMVNYVRYYKI